MRATHTGPLLKVRAIAGTYVVLIAWDFVHGNAPADDLLGFGIRREELRDGKVVARKWLQGIKRFKDKDNGVPPGTPMRTNEHPIQSFQWADYTAFSERSYRYQVVPVHGTPQLLRRDYAHSTIVDVRTEATAMPVGDDASATRHDIHFNRGVIGSQAFAREFPDAHPTPDTPAAAPEMKWLSRGLYEALTAFIALAGDERYKLRAAFYEFHYQPVVNALARAVEGGADVKIVYDAASASYKAKNKAAIDAAGLEPNTIPRTVSEGIRHNKFIVLFKDEQPLAVWTGSTNVSAGGIFGHLNVGHVVWDAALAAAYADYWERLSQNLTPAKLRPKNREATPLPHDGAAAHKTVALFSARDEKDDNSTLEFYARLMNEAKQLMCFTVAFNLDKVFQQVICQQNDVLRYVVKDDDLADGETLGRDHDVLFAAGGHLEAGALANFLAEPGNPLNQNQYIHTKFMLVDPLGNDPIVVSGSANFSRPSQRVNDENMLVIRGDTRVADIYVGEFFRIFDHHYARYVVHKLTAQHKSDPNAGYLKETMQAWLPPHFDPKSPKSKRRRYFVG